MTRAFAISRTKAGSLVELALPCVAPDWPRYELTYRHRSATYHIVVDNAAGTGRGVRAVTVDAHAVPDGEISLLDDGKTHEVRVELG